MPKVYVFNHYAMTPYNGTIVRHYQFAPYWEQMGWETTIFSSSAIHNSDVNEITDGSLYKEKDIDGRHFVYVRTPSYTGNGLSRIKNMYYYYRNVKKTARRFEKPDIVYASSPQLFALLAGLHVARRWKVPCVCEVRDLWPESIFAYKGVSRKHPAMRVLYRLERYLYKRADKLVFTMSNAYEYIRERKWEKVVPQEKCCWVTNSVDLALFDEQKKTCIQDEPYLAQKKDSFTLLYCGSLRHVNNLQPLIDAVSMMPERGCPVRLLVYGEGNERESLEAYCRDNHIDNVVFRGFVPKQYIASLVSRADVNMMHGGDTGVMRFGISTNKLYDYLAAGKPILMTFFAGRSPVQQYNCGIMLDTPDPEKIADAIETFCHMPQEERDAMGRRARDAAEEFNTPVLARKMVDIWEEALAEKK